MSGNNESVAKKAMDTEMLKLDEYEQSLGLPEHSIPNGMPDEIKKYLGMNRDELEKLNPEDCVNTAYIIGQFVFFLQREQNRESSREIWAKSEMDKLIAGKIESYSQYTKTEHKIANIARENSVVADYNSIYHKAQRRKARLEYIAASLKSLADTLKDIYRAKINNLRNERSENA